MDSVLLEAVPNFSEGRDAAIISALLEAASSIPGARLLDHTSDRDHNRTVLTIAGPPSPVSEAVFASVETAVRLIRLRAHQGVHPRIGAADVVPFVPVSGISLDECAVLARQTAERIWTQLHVPVFLYGAAAQNPARAALEMIRSPKFTGDPDFGQGRHASAGAAIVGARKFLVAWNINLNSENLGAAREIARAVRASSGGLACVKALGLELKSRGQVQVSMNLTDFETTPLHKVFERVRREADRLSIGIAGSELIGLIPQRALDLSRGYDLQWLIGDRIHDFVLETRITRPVLPSL